MRPIKKSNEYSLREAIDEMLKTYRLDRKLDETKVLNAWEKVVGAVISRYTSDLRINDGVLYVGLTSAALKQELLYRRTEIADLLNTECGGPIVREIVIR